MTVKTTAGPVALARPKLRGSRACQRSASRSRTSTRPALRRLDGVQLDYLFLDASFFRMHPGSPAEPVLAAWGITTDGKPAFIGLGPGLTAYLRFPAEHHHRIRHSNFERTSGETRRRTKVIGRLPGETSCLTLVWAVLDRASRGWRGLTMTSDDLRLLQDLRRS